MTSQLDVRAYWRQDPRQLQRACVQNDAARVFELLDAGCSPNTAFDRDGTTPLMECAMHNHVAVATTLVAFGADVLAYLRNSPFSNVLRYTDVLERLDVDAGDTSGRTALWLASRCDNRDMVRFLCRYADIDKTSDSGRSPLFVACRLGHVLVAQLLLENGANVNLVTRFLASPLDAACQHSPDRVAVELATLLCNFGADTNFNGVGSTPLFVACQNAHVTLANVLIKNGADINLRTKSGVSCLDIVTRGDPDDDDAQVARRLTLESTLLGLGAKLTTPLHPILGS